MSRDSIKQNDLRLTERAFFWDVLLKTYSPQAYHLDQPSPLTSVKLDLLQQRTLHLDVPRTRCQIIPQSSHLMMESVITHFCKLENLSYKQGINEFFGVVSVFNAVGLSWEKIWEYGRAIILNFSNNLFQDEDFLSLQITLSFVNLLLKYHDPQLQHYIEVENCLTPELYATPWILTLFANKMSLEIVLLFWEAYFIENDQQLIIYIVVATLLHYKDKLTSIDPSYLPQTLTGIVISSKEHLSSIFELALQLRANTPLSFIEYILKSRIYDNYTANKDQERIRQIQIDVEAIQLMWMTVTECAKLLFPTDASIITYKRTRVTRTELKKFVSDNKDLHDLIEVKLDNPSYVLVDLRQNKTNCRFDKAVSKLEQKSKHYILMDEDGIQNLDQFILNAQIDGYKICRLNGGFKALHDHMLLFKIRIDHHQPEKCSYCGSKKSQNLKSDGIWNQFVKLFVQQDDILIKEIHLSPSAKENYNHLVETTAQSPQPSVRTYRPLSQKSQMDSRKQEPLKVHEDTLILVSIEKKLLPSFTLSQLNNKSDQKIHKQVDIIVPIKQERISHRQLVKQVSVTETKIIVSDKSTNQRNQQAIIDSRTASIDQSFNRNHFLKNYPSDKSKKYLKKGLFGSFVGGIQQFEQFLLIIKDNQFQVFRGTQINSKGESKRRILFISQEFAFIIDYSASIFQVLSLLLKNKIWHYIGQQAKQSLIQTLLQNENYQENTHFKIKQLYLMLFLKKISSKREDSLSLSFYFRQPQYTLTGQFFKFIEEFNMTTLFQIVYPRKLQIINEESNMMLKIELKMEITLENQQDVLNCIDQGKNFYKETLKLLHQPKVGYY